MLQSTSTSERPRAQAGFGSARELHFVAEPSGPHGWIAAARALLEDGHASIAARPLDPTAASLAAELTSALGPRFAGLQSSADIAAAPHKPSAILLLGEDADAASAALLDHLDEDCAVVAPLTERHWEQLPLFLISIPKAGTHLLFRLAEALGYTAGGELAGSPRGGAWYYLEYSNAHTGARDFFHDSLRQAPFGNRAHPFLRSPALFNYRHPFDILVSEANYFHVDGKSPLAALLGDMPFEQRLARLVDDRWLLGSLRDRIGAFIPWLDCGNVIPLSFEELVGDAGGGSDEALETVIWSLQLKLQVPGRPGDIRRRMSERAGATFREGRIGGWRGGLPSDIVSRLAAMPQDYLEAFGYDARQTGLSWRTEEFRRRPLRLSRFDPRGTPFIAETDYFGHNIVAFQGRYYAVATSLGPMNLDELPESELARFLNSDSISAVRGRVARRAILGGAEGSEFIAEQASRIVGLVRAQLAPDLQHGVTAAVEGISARLGSELEARLAQATEALEAALAKQEADFVKAIEDRLRAQGAVFLKAMEDRLHAQAAVFVRAMEDRLHAQETVFVKAMADRLQVLEDRLAQSRDAKALELEERLTRGVAEQIDALRRELVPEVAPAMVQSQGAFLRYNLFERGDGWIALPWRLGAVDPRQPALADTPGVIRAAGPLALRSRIAWAWVRWAYWDGARI